MSYPNNIVECLQHLFPDSVALKDWSVSVNVDDEISIDYWNDELGVKPTEKQLADVSEDAKKTAKFRLIRKKRNSLLKETDWWGSSDLVMSNERQIYRKKLRDLPASNSDPEKIIFPTKPTE